MTRLTEDTMTTARLGCLVTGLTLAWAPSALGQSMISPGITFTPNPGGGIVVAWPAVSQAAGYRLTRVKEEDPCCAWTVDLGSTTLSVVDGLTVPGTYQYAVTARLRRATSVTIEGTYYFAILDPPPMNRRAVTIVTACTPAQQTGGYPPSSVSSGTNTPTKALINWAAVPGTAAYKVERSSDQVNWTDLGCLPASQTWFSEVTRTDVSSAATVWPGRMYTYKVTAYSATGAAGWNSTRVWLPIMRQPSNVTAQRTGNAVLLCWLSVHPDRHVIATSYGTDIQISGASTCRQMLGVPDGLQTFWVGSVYYGSPGLLEPPVNTRTLGHRSGQPVNSAGHRSLPGSRSPPLPEAPMRCWLALTISRRFRRSDGRLLAVAQRVPAVGAAHRPGWVGSESRFSGDLSAADKAIVVRRLAAIERILLEVPELAHPDGFEIRSRMEGGAPTGPGNVVSYRYSLWIAAPVWKGNEGCACLEVVINPPGKALNLWGQPSTIRDAQGDLLYVEDEIGEPVSGSTLGYGNLSETERSWRMVLLSVDGVSPWIPVSRQEYLEALIFDWEGKDGEKVKGLQESLQKTRYQQWVEGAPTRKKTREAIVAGVRAVNPARADSTLKELEDAERSVTEQLEAAEAQDREQAARTEAQGMPGDPIRAQLAAYTPAERELPAWTFPSLSLASLGPRAPGKVRIVRRNPDFYRARHSRLEPRGIMVRFTASMTGHRPPVQRALWRAYQTLDWPALIRMLEE